MQFHCGAYPRFSNAVPIYAYPMQCEAIRCCSIPFRCAAALLDAIPFRRTAMPIHCSVNPSLACPTQSSAFRRPAPPFHCCAMLSQSNATPYGSIQLPFFALRSISPHFQGGLGESLLFVFSLFDLPHRLFKF